MPKQKAEDWKQFPFDFKIERARKSWRHFRWTMAGMAAFGVVVFVLLPYFAEKRINEQERINELCNQNETYVNAKKEIERNTFVMDSVRNDIITKQK